MTLMSTSPTATKSRTLPSFPASMAAAHSRAICSLRSWAYIRSRLSFPGLQTTAKRTLPIRSQFMPMAW